MRIYGKYGPSKITVLFEEGEFTGKSVTMEADQLIHGVALYASTLKTWDGDGTIIDSETKKKIVELIRKEFTNRPDSKSEIVD